ncbi:RNA methyltransferase [Clostridium sp. D33t1_170424_F3]|uniref:TrmH family RNA methyltransferase n=1 Tax=Clostridium sp. D33t1_170424_F3 TaxID=2787099 RepID=UPI00257099DE|nr:RNA methyltransferase [Clostridium sp. D33t1_170424_F3]
MLEGARLCRDAAESGVPVQTLFYTEQAEQKYAWYLEPIAAAACQVYLIEPHVAELLSETKNTQGIFCVCSIREALTASSGMTADRQYLALENIQDPGNLGAVLRTAEALGIGGVLLAGSCCDVYSPKVLRASMGAVFRLPFFFAASMAEAAGQLHGQGLKTYAAVPDHTAADVTKIRFSPGSVVVVGNEGNGLEPATIEACGASVTIPMKGRAESLNAASSSAILMWELMRCI